MPLSPCDWCSREPDTQKSDIELKKDGWFYGLSRGGSTIVICPECCKSIEWYNEED